MSGTALPAESRPEPAATAPERWQSTSRNGVRLEHAPGLPRPLLEFAADLVAGIEGDPARFQDLTGHLLKSNKTRIYRLETQGEVFYLKHHARGERLRSLKNRLRPPSRSARMARRLWEAGVPSLEPVAVVRGPRGCSAGLLAEGALITRGLKGPNLREVIRDRRLPGNTGESPGRSATVVHQALARELGYVWGRMIAAGFLHMDPMPQNFIAVGEPPHLRIHVIDLGDVVRVPVVPWAIAVRRTSKLFFGVQRRACLHDFPFHPNWYRGFVQGWEAAWRDHGHLRDRTTDRAFFRAVRAHARSRWRAYAETPVGRGTPIRG